MARKARIEIEGGLYHIVTRGNNRQRIFGSHEDYAQMLRLLEAQKARLPFYLYAYCLMPNHIHLLVERQTDPISRIMHRLLTGYTQYHNRRYRKVGHLLQGRYKAILCQTDQYLAELVRYVHLNPVRAKLARRPEDYPYSGHRAYLGLDKTGLVDVQPLLRGFGARKQVARETYQKFVRAGMKLGHQEEFYQAEGGRILGSEEFVDSTIHRIGETGALVARAKKRAGDELDLTKLVEVVELATGVRRSDFCGPGKSARIVMVKEALVYVGRAAGATNAALAKEMGLESSVVSRRYEAARQKILQSPKMSALVKEVQKKLWPRQP
jgi:REP-associated tyrosine transposase